MAGGRYPARVKEFKGDRRDLREKTKAGVRPGWTRAKFRSMEAAEDYTYSGVAQSDEQLVEWKVQDLASEWLKFKSQF